MPWGGTDRATQAVLTNAKAIVIFLIDMLRHLLMKERWAHVLTT
jgi:hypothetical protein